MSVVVERPAAVASRSVAALLGEGVESGSVVTVTGPDGPVAGWLVVDEAVDDEGERRCAVVATTGDCVPVTGLVSQVVVVGEPVRTPGVMPPWVTVLAEATREAERALLERDQARQALSHERARLERIVDDAHAYADENSLCEAFDEFMEAHGLRARSREYLIEVDATVRVTVRVEARDGDAAEEQVSESMLADQLCGMSASEFRDAIEGREVVNTYTV